MFTPHYPHTLRTIIVTGLLGLGLGLTLGASLLPASGARAQDDRAHFSSSAFDTPAVLATGTRDAPGVAASSERNVAVDAYSTAGIAMRGRSNGSGDGVEGMSASGVGGAAALHLVPARTTGHPTAGPHLRGDLLIDRTGTLWLCTATGTPGTWRQILTAAK